ncbi:MAG: DUF4395 domain-containing protein [Actinoplanes sp.]
MELDPRGQRFAAALTSVVLIVVLATGWWWLALAQTLVFAVTAANPRRGPYAYVFRAVVLPRIGPPAEQEPVEPVRFAQLVGFCFLAVSTVGYAVGAPVVGLIFAAFGLLAAFLNAAFGLCLGCEAYLAIRRLRSRTA